MARNVEFDEEKVIQKAMEVFWKKGYSATSMRDLTDAMQINISSLYNTIGDKHELFVKCIRYYSKLRVKEAEEQYANSESPAKALEKYIKDVAIKITSSSKSCMCVKTTFEIEGNDTEVQKAVNEYNDKVHLFMKQLVEKAQDSGYIKSDEDADTVADYLDSLFTGWYNSYITHNDKERILKMASLSIRHLKN